ncbi:hypothetical protein ACFQ4K_23690 [Tistrella bauzanensis]
MNIMALFPTGFGDRHADAYGRRLTRGIAGTTALVAVTLALLLVDSPDATAQQQPRDRGDGRGIREPVERP